MSYQYDIFISYHRLRWGKWVKSHLYRFIDKYLEGALGREPSIFLDEEIETGEVWPLRLVEAVARSRCMIGVWSPSYFSSAWCRYECLTMLERSKITGGVQLLLPVVVSDGHGFPQYAKPIQWIDCQDFVYEGRGFEDSPDYLDFQKLIKAKVTDITNAIHRAPAWQQAWLESHVRKLPEVPKPKVPPPFLE